MRSALGPRPLPKLVSGQRHPEAGRQAEAAVPLVVQAHLGPQRDVAPVRHVAEVGIAQGGHAGRPLHVHLHGVGGRPDEAQHRAVQPRALAAGQEVGLVAHEVAADLEHHRAGGGGGRLLGLQRPRLRAGRGGGTEEQRQTSHGEGSLHGARTAIMERWLLPPDASRPPVPAATPTPRAGFRIVVAPPARWSRCRSSSAPPSSSTTTCTSA